MIYFILSRFWVSYS